MHSEGEGLGCAFTIEVPMQRTQGTLAASPAPAATAGPSGAAAGADMNLNTSTSTTTMSSGDTSAVRGAIAAVDGNMTRSGTMLLEPITPVAPAPAPARAPALTPAVAPAALASAASAVAPRGAPLGPLRKCPPVNASAVGGGVGHRDTVDAPTNADVDPTVQNRPRAPEGKRN